MDIPDGLKCLLVIVTFSPFCLLVAMFYCKVVPVILPLCELDQPNFFCANYNLISVITLSLQAIIHPDTGEKIFMPFRMSGRVARCGWSRGPRGPGACYVVQHGGDASLLTLGTVRAQRGFFRLSQTSERSHSAGG